MWNVCKTKTGKVCDDEAVSILISWWGDDSAPPLHPGLNRVNTLLVCKQPISRFFSYITNTILSHTLTVIWDIGDEIGQLRSYYDCDST